MSGDMVVGNQARKRWAVENGLDVMYAEQCHLGFYAWTYSYGVRVSLRNFATLEGIQAWATRKKFVIIFVD